MEVGTVSLKPFLSSILATPATARCLLRPYDGTWVSPENWAKSRFIQEVKVQGTEVTASHSSESITSEQSSRESQHFLNPVPSLSTIQDHTFIYWVLTKCAFLRQCCAIETQGTLPCTETWFWALKATLFQAPCLTSISFNAHALPQTVLMT